MAPEIFKKSAFLRRSTPHCVLSVFFVAGHGKPVDIWAMGVVTYFLLAGYTPFDRDSQQHEMEAIIAGDYKFEPVEYWANVSDTAKSFVTECLTIDPASRPTASEALQHKVCGTIHFLKDRNDETTSLVACRHHATLCTRPRD
jgi:calcium/calmodulin-dependent protein kinase I